MLGMCPESVGVEHAQVTLLLQWGFKSVSWKYIQSRHKHKKHRYFVPTCVNPCPARNPPLPSLGHPGTNGAAIPFQ
eukprot:2728452-Amphidinium_carterae.1